MFSKNVNIVINKLDDKQINLLARMKVKELLQHGYYEEDIKNILSGLTSRKESIIR